MPTTTTATATTTLPPLCRFHLLDRDGLASVGSYINPGDVYVNLQRPTNTRCAAGAACTWHGRCMQLGCGVLVITTCSSHHWHASHQRLLAHALETVSNIYLFIVTSAQHHACMHRSS
jgi:hypothetical protein